MLSLALLLAIVTCCSDLAASANAASASPSSLQDAAILHTKFTKRDLSEEANRASLSLTKLLIAQRCASLEQGQGPLPRLCLEDGDARQQEVLGSLMIGDRQQQHVPALHKKWLSPDFAVQKKWLTPDFVQVKRKRRDVGSSS